MDIKMEIKCLVVYAKCQQQAEYDCDRDAEVFHAQSVRRSLRKLNRWADMAEAALAFCEYQVHNGWDSNVDGATYIRERGRLWDAFIMARAKVKGASNGST